MVTYVQLSLNLTISYPNQNNLFMYTYSGRTKIGKDWIILSQGVWKPWKFQLYKSGIKSITFWPTSDEYSVVLPYLSKSYCEHGQLRKTAPVQVTSVFPVPMCYYLSKFYYLITSWHHTVLLLIVGQVTKCTGVCCNALWHRSGYVCTRSISKITLHLPSNINQCETKYCLPSTHNGSYICHIISLIKDRWLLLSGADFQIIQ